LKPPLGVTPPFVKNCTLRGKVGWKRSAPKWTQLPISDASVRGMAECLRVTRETLDFLKEQRIEAHIFPTAQAAELYNRLAKEGPVGGLFHTTC